MNRISTPTALMKLYAMSLDSESEGAAEDAETERLDEVKEGRRDSVPPMVSIGRPPHRPGSGQPCADSKK